MRGGTTHNALGTGVTGTLHLTPTQKEFRGGQKREAKNVFFNLTLRYRHNGQNMTNYFEELIGHFPRNGYQVAAGKIVLHKEGESATYFLKVGHTNQEQIDFFSILNKEVDEEIDAEINYKGTTIWFTDGSYAIIRWQYDGRDDRYYFGWDFYYPNPIPKELL